MLVGTQVDLRDDVGTLEKLQKNRQKPVTIEVGEKLAKELRAVKYVECSALTQVSAAMLGLIMSHKRVIVVSGSCLTCS